MGALATRFSGRSINVASTRPLTDSEVMQAAPSVFAEAPHESRSDRYAYIPTSTVLTALRNEGFQPFAVTQGRSRTPGKMEFTKHMLRLRHTGENGFIAGKGSPEIVLINSHDGASSFQLLAGWFEFLCSNGLVCGNVADDIRVLHKGDIISDVTNGAFAVLDGLKTFDAKRDEMLSVPMSHDERRMLASAALELRWDSREGTAPIEPDQILLPRRAADREPNLWKTFNVIQENMIQGGIRGRNANGRRMQTREIRNIDGNVKLNRALFTLAEEFQRLKAAA